MPGNVRTAFANALPAVAILPVKGKLKFPLPIPVQEAVRNGGKIEIPVVFSANSNGSVLISGPHSLPIVIKNGIQKSVGGICITSADHIPFIRTRHGIISVELLVHIRVKCKTGTGNLCEDSGYPMKKEIFPLHLRQCAERR